MKACNIEEKQKECTFICDNKCKYFCLKNIALIFAFKPTVQCSHNSQW